MTYMVIGERRNELKPLVFECGEKAEAQKIAGRWWHRKHDLVLHSVSILEPEGRLGIEALCGSEEAFDAFLEERSVSADENGNLTERFTLA